MSKIGYFLYQKGLGVAKPDYLDVAEFASQDWFRLAETIMKDNHRDGRHRILDHLLHRRIRVHPKRKELMRLIGVFLTKGILDERRRVVKFIDENITLFNPNDEAIYGALLNAQRDSDSITSNTAESAVMKLRGEV
ncbi:MAG TPA: hypothetical protein VLH08_09470 [Acidobacteriota bacterium]|jgi:hypothetical protein|nr:hypothetical protein [Acidobacteriota bacterium]